MDNIIGHILAVSVAAIGAYFTATGIFKHIKKEIAQNRVIKTITNLSAEDLKTKDLKLFGVRFECHEGLLSDYSKKGLIFCAKHALEKREDFFIYHVQDNILVFGNEAFFKVNLAYKRNVLKQRFDKLVTAHVVLEKIYDKKSYFWNR